MMETCGRCGEEIRFGTRGGVTKFWHRGPVDHEPAHGKPWTPEDSARQQAYLDQLRVRPVGEVKDDLQAIEFYTVRGFGLKGEAAKAYAALHAPEEAEIPEPEQRAIDYDPALFPPRSGIRQIINLIGKTDGWEVKRVTYARGPWLGANGKVLSIADTHKVSALGPVLDSGQRFVVALWKDMEFETGYTGHIRGKTAYPDPANSTAIKAFIKEPPP